MIRLIKVKKVYPGFVLKDISFEINKGEIFGLLGPNGAGKTTTIRIILNLVKRDGGEILRTENLDIGFVLENEEPFENLFPVQYLKFFSRIKGGEEKVPEILELLNLTPHLNKLNKELSKGTKKKLCLAKAIIGDPDLLILDEPLEGIEPEIRKEIREFLLRFKESNKSVLITSHELFEIENMCNKIGIIYGGKFLGKYDVEEILKKFGTIEEFYLKKLKKFFSPNHSIR